MIARRYHVGAVALAHKNGLTLASVITPGQRLRIPGITRAPKQIASRRTAPTVVHTVQPGEGFIAIAGRYGVQAAKLARANGLVLTSVLTAGQRLRVPGSGVAAAEPRRRHPASRHDRRGR